MARQEKGKNELDAILEQLKRSYGSDSSDVPEDDDLGASAPEEDVELSEILGKIFASDPDQTKDNGEGVVAQIDEDTTENDCEPEVLTVEDEESSLEQDASLYAIDTEAQDDGGELENAPSATENEQAVDDVFSIMFAPKDKSAAPLNDVIVDLSEMPDDENDTEYDISEPEEVSILEDTEIVSETIVETACESEVIADEDFVEAEDFDDAEVMADAVSEEFDDAVVTADVAEEEAVDNVDGIADDIEEAYFDEAPEMQAEAYDGTEDVYDEPDADDSDYEEASEDVDDDISVDGDVEEFAVEDEEYDTEETSDEIIDDEFEDETEDEGIIVGETTSENHPYPVFEDIKDQEQEQHLPKLVLLSEDYTHDPLQETLPVIGISENRSNSQASSKVSVTESVIDDTREKRNEESFDRNDISMLLNFGYENEVKNKVGEKKTKEILLEDDSKFKADAYEKPFGFCGKELTDRSQISEIYEKYRSNLKALIVMLSSVSVLSFLIMILDLVFEFSTDKITSYPLMLTLEFALVLIISVVLYKKIFSGLASIFKFEMKESSVYSFITLLYGAYAIVSLLVYLITYQQVDQRGLMLIGFCVSLYAVFSLVSDLLNCIREYNVFKTIASTETLYTAEKQSSFSAGGSRSRKKVNDNCIYKVRRTSLVSGYFRKTVQCTKGALMPIYLISIVPIISLVIGCICFFYGKSPTTSLSITMLTVMLCLPLGYVCAYAVVDFVTSKWCKDKNIAFIGSAAAEEMSKAELLIFKDNDTVEITAYTEIQPSNRDDVNESLKIAYELFNLLGGPLSSVGERSDDISGTQSHDIVINDVSERGIDVYFNSSINILMGDRQYMYARGIKVKTDGNLSTAIRGVDRTVLYIAFDGVPKLGFIVNSRVKSKFIKTADALSKEGVKVFVETYEPQLNMLYYEQNKGDCNATIGVVKPERYENEAGINMCDGCVISATDGLDIAQAIFVGKAIRKEQTINGVVNIVLSIFGVAVSCFFAMLAVTGGGQFAFFNFLSEHMTILFGVTTVMGLIPAIVETIRLGKRKK